MRVWDARTGEPVGSPLYGHRDSVYALAVGPARPGSGAPLVATGSKDKSIRIWDLTHGCVGELHGHSAEVFGLAFAPHHAPEDPVVLVSGSHDATVRVWDVGALAAVGAPLTGHTERVRGVDVAPTARHEPLLVASGGKDCLVILWNATAQVCARCTTTVNGVVNGVMLAQCLAPPPSRLPPSRVARSCRNTPPGCSGHAVAAQELGQQLGVAAVLLSIPPGTRPHHSRQRRRGVRVGGAVGCALGVHHTSPVVDHAVHFSKSRRHGFAAGGKPGLDPKPAHAAAVLRLRRG